MEQLRSFDVHTEISDLAFYLGILNLWDYGGVSELVCVVFVCFRHSVSWLGCVEQGFGAGVWRGGGVSLRPLFSYPTLYSYSQTQNSSLSLLWYRHTHTHELEQPINLKLHTLHKDASTCGYSRPRRRTPDSTSACSGKHSHCTYYTY